jgi:hypothetical protein
VATMVAANNRLMTNVLKAANSRAMTTLGLVVGISQQMIFKSQDSAMQHCHPGFLLRVLRMWAAFGENPLERPRGPRGRCGQLLRGPYLRAARIFRCLPFVHQVVPNRQW